MRITVETIYVWGYNYNRKASSQAAYPPLSMCALVSIVRSMSGILNGVWGVGIP
jgi:hypothetical protein